MSMLDTHQQEERARRLGKRKRQGTAILRPTQSPTIPCHPLYPSALGALRTALSTLWLTNTKENINQVNEIGYIVPLLGEVKHLLFDGIRQKHTATQRKRQTRI